MYKCALSGNHTSVLLFGIDDALIRYGEIARGLGVQYLGSVVAFNAPVAKLNFERQALDPTVTLIRIDRIHPGELAHLLMTYSFLKAQGRPSCVSTVAINARLNQVVASERHTVTQLKNQNNGELSFIYHAQYLPVPLITESKQID